MSDRNRAVKAPDQDQRDMILAELDANLLVEAAAGTGKTTSMVGRMIALIATGKCADLGKMVAVTFTRKAAAELRSRFQVKLEQSVREADDQEKPRLAAALEKAEQCFVGTIHSFCAKLLRERPVEAGVDISFEAIEPEADALIRREAWSNYSAWLYLNDRSGIIEELDSLGLSLGELEYCFGRFADYPDVDLWPVRGIDYRVFREMENRRLGLEQYIAHMRTLVPKFPDDTGRDRLMNAYRKIVRMAVRFDPADPADFMRLIEAFDSSPNTTQQEWAKNGLFEKKDAKAEQARWELFREETVKPLLSLWHERRYEPVMRVMTGAREEYDRLRQSKGLLNYQDLLMKAAALLKGKPHIRRYFSSRYTHLLVDEFHDTDPIQAEMMMLLTAEDPDENDWRKCSPRPGSLFVVGDPKQSIYRFRRADIVTYNEVKEIIRRSGGRAARLSANFRSSPEIVDWVNGAFGPASDAAGSAGGDEMPRFEGSDSEVSPAYVPMQAGRERADLPLAGIMRLDVPEAANQKEAVLLEADFIARAIRSAIDGGMRMPVSGGAPEKGKSRVACPGDFMIVTYNTVHLSKYGQALQKYGIPHQVTGGAALNEVEELKLFYRCLKAAVEPDNPVSLVAALRSGVFGVSDAALYAFKKAGGYFSFRSRIPDDLKEEHAGPIREAFLRLERFGAWLSKMPFVSAFERILGDIGLAVQASLGPGGDVEAGSLAKAMEIIRGAQKGVWSVEQLVSRLGALADASEAHDGISVRPDTRSVVRVMNLHKVKGLEANVVFLACPSGGSYHAPDICVDRSGGKVTGYLRISKRKSEFQSETLALPPDWDVMKAREDEFAKAEKLRLRYVAATRAGRALVISNRRKSQTNPWKLFLENPESLPALDDPGPQRAPEKKKISMTDRDVKKSMDAMFGRLTAATMPTYCTEGAKAYALLGRENPMPSMGAAPERSKEESRGRSGEQDEHGVEWGEVIHLLLQTAMSEPKTKLKDLAGTLLAEHGLDESLAEAAENVVISAMRSDIWKRAARSEKRFIEIPFQVLLDRKDKADLPTVVRGSMDLVFNEEDGWVVVDYKTDSLKGTSPHRLAEKYAPQVRLYAKAWEKCTGEKVKTMGLLFTGIGKMVEVAG